VEYGGKSGLQVKKHCVDRGGFIMAHYGEVPGQVSVRRCILLHLTSQRKILSSLVYIKIVDDDQESVAENKVPDEERVASADYPSSPPVRSVFSPKASLGGWTGD
jgi:hypothetical protein